MFDFPHRGKHPEEIQLEQQAQAMAEKMLRKRPKPTYQIQILKFINELQRHEVSQEISKLINEKTPEWLSAYPDEFLYLPKIWFDCLDDNEYRAYAQALKDLERKELVVVTKVKNPSGVKEFKLVRITLPGILISEALQRLLSSKK